MNRMLFAVASCLPLLFSAVNVHSVELVGPNEEPQLIQSAASVASTNTASTSSSRYGPVTSNETLWSISTKLRPNNDVSVYQTLVAIYKTNPSAFRNGDINKIIATSVINVPSVETIAQQTNAEAFRLLRITNSPAPSVAAKPAQTTDTEQKEVEPVNNAVSTAEETQQPEDIVTEQSTQQTNEQIQKLEAEYALLNEQLILATESNQRLKLKLQPLSDQINTLSDQVEQDINVQIELQALIDQYKAQIDAFEEPPFSGPGLLNSILSSITGSASTLLLTILSPLLLLTALFLLILRIKSKRELTLKEQELAESTALMDEEENEFDSLFSADMATEEVAESDTAVSQDDEGDLTIIEEQVDTSDELIANAETELINEEDDALANDDIDMDAVINGDDEVIELSESDLTLGEETSQRDLDLAAQWESELAELEGGEEEQVDLDDFEFDSPQEAPLAPIQLDEIETASDELNDADQREQPSAEISPDIEEDSSPEAIPEVEGLLAEDSPEEELSVEQTSAEELLKESAEDNEETAKEVEQTLDETTEAISEDVVPDAIPEIEALSDEEPTPSLDDVDAETSTDIDQLLADSTDEAPEDTAEDAQPVLDEESLDAEDRLAEATLDIEDNLDEEIVDEVDDGIDDEIVDDIDDAEALPEIEALLKEDLEIDDELDEHLSVESEEDIPEQAEAIKEDVKETLDFNDPDALAKQLSNNAFNEDAELPKFDKTDDKGFIDIDTLLTNEEGQELSEEEFDLDFGLDEFPDVVESFSEFDTDADGVAAQLDLARAYLEIDEKEGAKTILTQLLESAPEDKLKEVKKLYDRIS